MTEHEKFIEICDLIWMKDDTIYFWHTFWIVRKIPWEAWLRILNVREVIFTQEFMDLLEQYFNIEHNFDDIRYNIISHLNNPVQYLYDTLWLWNQ